MSKVVEYQGKTYKVETREYGYSSRKFIINGEESSKHISNSQLQSIPDYSSVAKEAIKEYELRYKTAAKFEEWDGKLD